MSGGIEHFNWELAYHVTSEGARDLVDESMVRPRLILTLGFEF